MSQPDRFERLRELDAKATPGPWEVAGSSVVLSPYPEREYWEWLQNCDECPKTLDDAALIAESRTALRALLQSHADLVAAIKHFDGALTQWSKAYPIEVFPEPDMDKAKAALEAAGLTMDCVSAHCMRHVVKCFCGDFIESRAALAAAEGKAQ